MKKVYLLVSGLLLTAGAVNAQTVVERAYFPIQKNTMRSQVINSNIDDRAPGDVIVSNTFDDASDWLIYTDGGTTANWEVVATEPAELDGYINDIESTTEADGFGVFNGIQYLLAGDVPPQNALLELDESIDCGTVSSVILQFEQAYRAFNSDRTFLEVTNDDWASYETFEYNTEKPGNGPTYQEKVTVNISSVAATETNVRVRFRWLEESGDDGVGSGYAWMVDDLTVREAWNYDQEITGRTHRSGILLTSYRGYDYYTIAENQIADIYFSGETNSLAGLVQENAKLNVEVTGAGTFSGTSTPADLPIAGTDSVSCEGFFTPAAIGTYDIVYSFDSDDTDEDLSNNSIEESISVHEYLYSRSDGVATASVSNTGGNSTQPFLYGNVMNIFADDQIGAIDIAVSNAATNVGQPMYGQIMRSTETGYEYLDQTIDHEITSSENGGFITLFFDEPIDVFEGDEILVLGGHYGSSDDIQFSTSQVVEDTSVVGFVSGSETGFFFPNAGAVMINIHMKSYVGLDQEVGNNFSISQNIPNPFGENSVINYELNEASNVSVEFVDVSGKLVYSINNGEQAAGTYTLDVDANNFAEGVYFYTFTVGAEKITKRMIVTK